MIFFRFGADASEVREEGKSAKEVMAQLRKEARQGVNDVAKWGAAMVAAAAVLGTHVVNNARAAIDAQAKLARSLDTTSKSLAVLERAGELSGVELNNIEQATKDLTRRLSQAAAGMGPAKDALDRLKLSAQQLRELPLDERIALINQRINDFIPAAQRAAVAGQLFGEEGSIAMQRIDPETIREARIEAEAFGTALSEVDAAKVEMANDAISSISLMVKGLIQRFTVELAPVLTAIAEHFKTAAKESGNFSDHASKGMDTFVTAAGFALDAIESIKRTFQIVADGIIQQASRLKKGILFPFEGLTALLANLPGEAGRTFADMNANIKAEMELADGVIGQTREHIDELIQKPLPSVAFKQFVEDARAAADEAAQAMVDAREKMSGGEEGGGLVGPDLDKLKQNLEALRQSYATEAELLKEKLETEREILAESYENKLIDAEEYMRREHEISQYYADALTEMEKEAADKRKKIAEEEKKARMAIAQSTLGGLSALMNTESRKLFEIGKAAAIANALVSTYQGVANALASVPFPANLAAAAAVGAQGFAQVSAIRSQQFGGGGAGAQATGSNTAAVNAGSQPVAPPGGGDQTVFVSGLGANDIFSGSMVRDLASKLLKFQEDGAQVVFEQ